MRTAPKLAALVAVLAVLFGGAYGVGHAVGPLRDPPAPERHDGDMPGMRMGER